MSKASSFDTYMSGGGFEAAAKRGVAKAVAATRAAGLVPATKESVEKADQIAGVAPVRLTKAVIKRHVAGIVETTVTGGVVGARVESDTWVTAYRLLQASRANEQTPPHPKIADAAIAAASRSHDRSR